MKQKNILIIVILAIFLIIPTVTQAQVEKDVKVMIKRGGDLEWIEKEDFGPLGRCMMTDKLNLTEDQKMKVEKMRFDMQKKQIDAWSKVKTAQVELREIFAAENPDRAAIEKKIKEISELKTKLRLNHIDHWFAVNKILTPEQQKIWKKSLMHPMGKRKMNLEMDLGPKLKKFKKFKMHMMD